MFILGVYFPMYYEITDPAIRAFNRLQVILSICKTFEYDYVEEYTAGLSEDDRLDIAIMTKWIKQCGMDEVVSEIDKGDGCLVVYSEEQKEMWNVLNGQVVSTRTVIQEQVLEETATSKCTEKSLDLSTGSLRKWSGTLVIILNVLILLIFLKAPLLLT